MPDGCESKIGTQHGTQVNGNMDQNLRSPGGFILTHTQMKPCGLLRVQVAAEAEACDLVWVGGRCVGWFRTDGLAVNFDGPCGGHLSGGGSVQQPLFGGVPFLAGKSKRAQARTRVKPVCL